MPTPGPTRLDVAADLQFTVDLPGRAPVRGSLSGTGGRLELRVSDPGAFAGRGDSDSVRGLAAALAARGLVVRVVAGDATLLTLGATRTSWLQRRLTGSRHVSVGGARGAWTGARGRLRAGAEAVLPDQTLAPPSTLVPLAPTFLRRARRPVTTTHDPGGGGNPRLILAPRADPWPGDRQPVYPLGRSVTTIGSAADCDVRLPGLEPRHAEVRHDADDDEYVLVSLGRPGDVRVNGEPVGQRILRTASRVELGGWTLSFYREEYADHGRPYGGRIGGELGHQRPQPSRRRLQDSATMTQGETS
jgi:hypothetical protein